MKPDRRGVTLIELALTLVFAGLVSSISIARAGPFVDAIRVRSAVTDIESLFSLARHAAIARSGQVILEIDGLHSVLRVRAGPELLRVREIGADHGVMISSNRPSVTYSPVGLGYGASNLSLIVSRNRSVDTVVVSRLGRVRH